MRRVDRVLPNYEHRFTAQGATLSEERYKERAKAALELVLQAS
jgi:hypothetical protein